MVLLYNAFFHSTNTAFENMDPPAGIHLHIVYDPSSDKVLEANSYDIVAVHPGERQVLDKDLLQMIYDRVGKVKSDNTRFRTTLRQIGSITQKEAQIPQDIFKPKDAENNVVQGMTPSFILPPPSIITRNGCAINHYVDSAKRAISQIRRMDYARFF